MKQKKKKLMHMGKIYMQGQEARHCCDIMKELTNKWGLTELYCVTMTIRTYHNDPLSVISGQSIYRSHFPIKSYHYTPLLCLLGFDIEEEKQNEPSIVSYEVSKAVKSVPMNICIDGMMSMKHPLDSIHLKLLDKMRKNAVKFGETDQLEKLLLTLVDKFPSDDLVNVALKGKDLELTKHLMPWIRDRGLVNGYWLGWVIDVFPDEMMHDLIDHAYDPIHSTSLGNFVDVAISSSSDDLLIHLLKKFKHINIYEMPHEKVEYVENILERIRQPIDVEMK